MEKKDVPDPQKSSVPAPGKRPVPTFYLKVRLHCCETCFRRAKERLQKIHGVVAINIVDTKQELLAVSGTVDPQKIIEKFADWGKKAVLWNPQNDSAQFSKENNAQVPKKAHDDGCTEDDTDSDCSDDHSSSTITWQHPDLIHKLAATAKAKGGKKQCWLLRLLGKTKNGDKLQGAGANSRSLAAKPGPRLNAIRPAVNSFPPRRPLHATYGNPMSFYPPYYGERPSYASMYNMPRMYGRPATPPFPYHNQQQPMHRLPPPAPLPYGFSGPISRPLINPMIHYTRDEDNYYRRTA